MWTDWVNHEINTNIMWMYVYVIKFSIATFVCNHSEPTIFMENYAFEFFVYDNWVLIHLHCRRHSDWSHYLIGSSRYIHIVVFISMNHGNPWQLQLITAGNYLRDCLINQKPVKAKIRVATLLKIKIKNLKIVNQVIRIKLSVPTTDSERLKKTDE